MDPHNMLDSHPTLKFYNMLHADNQVQNINIVGSIIVEHVKSVDNFLLLMSDTQEGLDNIKCDINKSIIDIGFKGNISGDINMGGCFDNVVYINGRRVQQSIVSNFNTANCKVIIGMVDTPDVSISGSGSFTSKEVDKKSVVATITGSGSIDLTGQTEISTLKVTGSGSIDAESLQSKINISTVTGSGTIESYATDSGVTNVTGSGTIKIYGNPPHKVDKVTGSGKIKFK